MWTVKAFRTVNCQPAVGCQAGHTVIRHLLQGPPQRAHPIPLPQRRLDPLQPGENAVVSSQSSNPEEGVTSCAAPAAPSGSTAAAQTVLSASCLLSGATAMPMTLLSSSEATPKTAVAM